MPEVFPMDRTPFLATWLKQWSESGIGQTVAEMLDANSSVSDIAIKSVVHAEQAAELITLGRRESMATTWARPMTAGSKDLAKGPPQDKARSVVWVGGDD